MLLLARSEMLLWPEPRCIADQSRYVTPARAEMLLPARAEMLLPARADMLLPTSADMLLRPEPICSCRPEPICCSGQSRYVTLAIADMLLRPEPICYSGQSQDVTPAKADMYCWPEARCTAGRNSEAERVRYRSCGPQRRHRLVPIRTVDYLGSGPQFVFLASPSDTHCINTT